MKQHLRLFLTMLLCAALGQAWSQEVTLDFTDSSWGFPTTKVVQATSYTNSDGYTITVEGTTGNGFRVYSNPAYFLFGQQGASITLPAFDFDVDKIEVEGRSGASSATLMNVFVGDVAVSTQTKGCQETNTYFIDNNYQDAGNVYKLKVVSAHNAQVTKIQIYKKGTSQPIDPTVTLTTNNIKVGETTSINTSPNLSVSYTSDAPGVATVNNAGEITGVSAGEAKIKATWVADNNYNAGSKEFTVTVSKYDAEVTLSTTSIKVGKTATISYPEDLTSILFGSDNESVATVNEDGVITGVSAGEATITAIWGDNKYNDGETEFTIIVAEANVGVAFVKVTNLNQVVAGNQYVLVTESGIAMGAQNGNFRDNVEIDLDGNVAYVNNDVAVLTLGGKAGAWTFSPSDTSGELSFISDENNQLVTKTNATDAQKLWRISNDFQVWHRAFSGRTIQTDTHFGCYKNTQTPSYLYVKQGSAIDENYKKDPVFSIANATIELNSNAKRLKVNTPSDGAITFTNITIATITSNGDGSYLAEALEEGEATVTATLEATDEYEGDETTFTVTVVPEHSNIASHLYKKVTSTSDITAGKYLIVYEVGSLAFDGSLTTLDAPSNTISVNITDDNKIFCDEDVYFLIDPEAGTIRSASGYYIGVTSNSNGLKQSKVANAYKNDFSIEDGNAVIFANFTSSTMYLRYNTGSGQERFRYFKNAGQQAIQLYKAVDPFSFSIKEIAYDGVDHYATISALGSEPYYEVSGGVEVFTLSVDQHKLVFSAPFTDGDVIPTKDASDKDVAYLVRGDVGDYQFTAAATPEKLVTLGENLLVSSGENGVTAEEMAKAPYENGYVFYKLSIHPRTKKAGFLWGAENGAAFDYTTGHQAYLAVPSGKLTTQSVSGYYFDGTTGIEELTLPQVVNDSPAYTLSGIRMTGKNLPKGVYVVNGKKVIIK